MNTAVVSETATYLYCVVRSGSKPSSTRVPSGLPGATCPTPVVLHPSLWLITAEVPLQTYGPEVLEPALQNLQWVADVAVAHEAVVEHFVRQRGATVIPMKLFTMFSTLDRALAEMRNKIDELEAVVTRIAGCEEWGVRIVRTAPRRPAARSASSSGVAYLAAKKQARDDALEQARRAADAAEAVFEELEGLTRSAWRRESVPEGATSPPILDAAFLVPVTQRARFRTAAKRLAARCAGAGAEMTLTGPWPAYSFVRVPGGS